MPGGAFATACTTPSPGSPARTPTRVSHRRTRPRSRTRRPALSSGKPQTSAGRPRRVASTCRRSGAARAENTPAGTTSGHHGRLVAICPVDVSTAQQVLRSEHPPPLVERQVRYATGGRLHARPAAGGIPDEEEAGLLGQAAAPRAGAGTVRRAFTSISARRPPASGPRPTTSTARPMMASGDTGGSAKTLWSPRQTIWVAATATNAVRDNGIVEEEGHHVAARHARRWARCG